MTKSAIYQPPLYPLKSISLGGFAISLIYYKSVIVLTDVRSQTTSDPVTSNNDVKQDLIQRGVQLKSRVNKYLIQKLVQQNRQHLSQPLKEEGDKIDGLVTELNNATDSVKLDILESELSDAEYRVNNEVTVLLTCSCVLLSH